MGLELPNQLTREEVLKVINHLRCSKFEWITQDKNGEWYCWREVKPEYKESAGIWRNWAGLAVKVNNVKVLYEGDWKDSLFESLVEDNPSVMVSMTFKKEE